MSQANSQAAAAAEEKRTRKQNWLPDETMCLVLAYKENQAMLRGSFTGHKCTNKGRQEAWLSVIRTLEASFPGRDRTIRDCQKRWQTIQSHSKARIGEYNKAVAATGKNVINTTRALIEGHQAG